MNRPYVICHLLASLDGKIGGSFFESEEAGYAYPVYGSLRRQYACDAVMNGAVTCAEIYASGYAGDLPETDRKFERTDMIHNTMKNYVVCLDPQGTLAFRSATVKRSGQPESHIIEVLCENVSDAYLAYLNDRKISWIFAGTEYPDMPLVMKKLKEKFGIGKVLMTGGGVMDWTMLENGLIDELSLVIAPSASGEREEASVFDQAPFHTMREPVGFALEEVKTFEGGVILLRYIPKNRKF